MKSDVPGGWLVPPSVEARCPVWCGGVREAINPFTNQVRSKDSEEREDDEKGVNDFEMWKLLVLCLKYS